MTRQTNFSGGELSPLMWGRTDLPIYGRGLRRMRNFFASREGMAISRPGTLFVQQTKHHAKRVRLVPFILSDTVAYALEFGEGYIRFHAHGATVLSGGVPLEVATTYTEADLPEIRWAQTGGVMTLTHPRHPPRELRSPVLVAGIPTPWSLVEVTFGPPSDAATGPAMAAAFVGIDGLAKATPALVDDPEDSLFVGDATHAPREWRYLVTASLKKLTTGETCETLPVALTKFWNGDAAGPLEDLPDDGMLVLFPDKAVLIRHPVFGAAVPKPQWWTVEGLNYYRGRGSLEAGLYGFVGTTRYAQDFRDLGELPDYQLPPPKGTNPFGDDEHPAAVAFFQEKRVWAGSPSRSARLWFSATGDYRDHDVPRLSIATQALEYELAARSREAIRHMATLGQLIIFTDRAVWRFGGASGQPLGPDSVEARTIDNVGCGFVAPLQVEGSLLWVRNKGRGARALFAGGNDERGFSAVDITVHSNHLFVGGEGATFIGRRTIIDWAYAEDPFGVVWAVREDGVLLSLTYSQQLQMAAWARHDSPSTDSRTDGAFFGAVCAIPEDGEDFVYVSVLRGDEWCIERFASRVLNDSPADGCCVDAGVKFEGAPTDAIDGLPAHLEGRRVWFTSNGPNPPYGPLRVTGGSITLPEVPKANAVEPGTQDGEWLIGYVGLRYVPEMETLDVGAGDSRLRQKAAARLGIEVSSSKGLEFGQTFDKLEEWEQRAVADGYNAPSTASELIVGPVLSTFDKGARAVIRQSLPLPVTVLAITTDVDAGG